MRSFLWSGGESPAGDAEMLSAIKASLMDAINARDEMSDGPMDNATICYIEKESEIEILCRYEWRIVK